MDYFTSDMHIGHDKDFIWQARGFSSIEEHDKEILKRWNSVVSPDDTVYILGDICHHMKIEQADDLIKKLNGKKNLVTGNHDKKYDVCYSISQNKS